MEATETVCSYLRKLNDLGEPLHYIELFGDGSGTVHNALGLVKGSHFLGRVEMFGVLQRLVKEYDAKKRCPTCQRNY